MSNVGSKAKEKECVLKIDNVDVRQLWIRLKCKKHSDLTRIFKR